MAFIDKTSNMRWLCLRILAMSVLIVCSGCRLSPERSFSMEEQYSLSATRSAQMKNRLEFSIELVLDKVPLKQDIFFIATFTNTTDQSVVFREPQQYGVIEAIYPQTTLLFVVEPLNVDTQFSYPFEGRPDILEWPLAKRDEFVTLLPHSVQRTRLKLPRLVFRDGTMGDVISLPPGQYRLRMTYMNDYIGYEFEQDWKTRYVDLGAWVGQLESNVVILTITP